MADQTDLFDEGRNPDEVIPRKFSGKPAGGRPKGAVGKTRKWVQKYLSAFVPQLLDAAVAEALAGDMMAMRIVLSYAIGLPRASVAVTVDNMPPMSTPDELQRAMHEFMQRAATGELAPEEAQSFVHMAHEILVAQKIDTASRPTQMIESQDGRTLLTERLIRAIEARKASGNGNGVAHAGAVADGDIDERLDSIMERIRLRDEQEGGSA